MKPGALQGKAGRDEGSESRQNSVKQKKNPKNLIPIFFVSDSVFV